MIPTDGPADDGGTPSGATPLSRPLRFARAALIGGLPVHAFFVLGLPFPTRGTDEERSAWLLWAALLGGSLVAAVALSARRRLGWATAVGVGALAASLLVSLVSDLVRAFVLSDAPVQIDRQQAIALSLDVIALALPLIAACGCLAERAWRAKLA